MLLTRLKFEVFNRSPGRGGREEERKMRSSSHHKYTIVSICRYFNGKVEYRKLRLDPRNLENRPTNSPVTILILAIIILFVVYGFDDIMGCRVFSVSSDFHVQYHRVCYPHYSGVMSIV